MVDSSPAIGSDGTIYFGSFDTKVYALGADGTKKWEFDAGSLIFSSPAIAVDGLIYIGSHGGKIYALSPDGTKVGEFLTEWSLVLACDRWRWRGLYRVV